MGIGTGTGIAGSAVPHQIYESVTTAFVETNKAALAIVPPDTYAVIPFSQQDAHMFYKYEAKAGDPMIATPPMKMRMAMEAEAEDMGWKPIYEELVKNLPTTLGEVIVAENKKPLTSRNSQLVVFNNLLIGTAKFMNWVQTASIPPQPNTPEAIRNELNAYLPAIALQGAITNCSGILSGVENYLSELGANFIGHDQALNLSGELNKLLPAFDTLSKKAAAGEDVKQSFVALADATHRLAELNKKEGANGGFQILDAILNTLDTLAASAALDRGPSTLLVSSHIASFDNSRPPRYDCGPNNSGIREFFGFRIRGQLDELSSLQGGLEPSGIVEDMKKKIPQDLMRLLRKYGIATPDQDKEYTVSELNQLIDQVDRLMQQKKKRRLEIPNQGNRRLLALLAQIVLLAINTAAVTLAESGIGPVPAKNEKDKKISKDLTFDVVAHMIVGSNLLTTLFNAIAGVAEANEKIQKIIAESLKLLSFLTVIRTATKGNEDRMISLVDDFSKEIEKSLDIIDNYLNEEIVTGNFSKRTSGDLALKLHESKLALQKGEINKFIKTCLGALDILDITPDLLAKNLKEIEEFANTFSEAITSRDENPTALTQQAM